MANFNTTVRQMTKIFQLKMTEMFQRKKNSSQTKLKHVDFS